MGWTPEFSRLATNGNLTIGIIGLGYVGLPTAIGFHDAGFTIWGVDISLRTVEMIKRGENPTGDPDLNKPDLSYIKEAGKAVFESIPSGSRTIVVLESTVYPGVTAQTWIPELNKLGMEIGHDVEIAYCPERISPGDPAHGVRQVARVIGCTNSEVGNDLVSLYRKLTTEDVRYVGKLEVAEASKVVENVQRDINIALVNELAQICPKLGIDVEEVLSAAATKWNFHRYTPGIGVGGHCIPVDPYYMIQRAEDVGVPAELITAARTVNRTMPIHVAGVLNEILYKAGVPSGAGRVLLLGWSYKAGVGDARGTPACLLAESLIEAGISVSTWDPYITESDISERVNVIEDVDTADGFDMVVLATAHPECISLDWEGLCSRMRTPILYDGRRVLDLNAMQAMGWNANAVGSPSNTE